MPTVNKSTRAAKGTSAKKISLPKEITALDIMDKKFVSFAPQMTLDLALTLMVDTGVSGGPVVNDKNKILGFLSERDVLRRLVEKPNFDLESANVESYMRQKVFSVTSEASLLELAEMFLNHWFHVFPVLDQEKVIGTVSRHSVSRAMQKSKIASKND